MMPKCNTRVGALILTLALAAFSPLFAQTNFPNLFEDPNRSATLEPESSTAVLRSRPVQVRTALLTESNNRDSGTAITLNLFDDLHITGVLETFQENASGSVTWNGYVDEFEHSIVTFVVNPDGVMAGTIKMPGHFYRLQFAGQDVHMLYDLDETRFPSDAEPLESFGAEEGGHEHEHGQAQQGSRDSSSQIDVLVVYTAAARSAAGGTSAMNALVDLAVSETNTSYNNSNVNTQLNLVYKGQVSYSETGNFSTELNRLTGKTDGYMDNVHSLRDQYCADEVVLIINATQYCGIANLMTSVSSSFENRAFSVVARTCATGYYSFGHELGHTMGARHDWTVDGNTSPYVYSHGYVNVSDRWRTVMAYNTKCSRSGVNCTRLPYWSNPGVNYQGDPMGVGGTSSGSAADNHRTLNNTIATIANFRDSSSSNCGSSTGGGNPGGCTGNSYTGSLSGSGSSQAQPNGTYYYTGNSGIHSGTLTGPNNADFDLYLYRWTGRWTQVATSTGATSSESINYNGASGYYYWRVRSDSGSGSYTLCLDTP